MILAAGVGLALSSCSTIQHTSQTAGVDTNVYNLTVADMNVAKQKQTMTTEWKWNPLSTVSLKAQKETATAELLKEANAEKIAKINGYCDSATVAFAYPVINTSVERPARKPRKAVVTPRLRREEPGRRQFVSLLGGGLIDVDDEFDDSFSAGLMYGNYGRSWGWYGKILVTHAEIYHTSGSRPSKTTPLVTAGAIKTLSPNWNCFFGLGLGGYVYGSFHERAKVKLSVPVDLGFQWRARHFNLMAGAAYTVPVTGSGSGSVAPFVGIGYSF